MKTDYSKIKQPINMRLIIYFLFTSLFLQSCGSPNSITTVAKAVSSGKEEKSESEEEENTFENDGDEDKSVKKIKAIPLGLNELKVPVQIDCKFYSPSNPTKDDVYSSSDEEDEVPRYLGVYNLTKTGNFNIHPSSNICYPSTPTKSSIQTQIFLPIKNSNDSLINNYAASEQQILPKQLNQDACDIWNKVVSQLKLEKKDKDQLTILCVALRQNDGRIKKFVFTTQSSIYQWHRDSPTTQEKILEITKEAHQRGYHVIMAQQAHAEGELLEFLQERPTIYTHLVAMGCDKDHCQVCSIVMQQEKVFGKDWESVSGSKVATKQYGKNWYMPKSLESALVKRGLSIEKFKKTFEKLNLNYDGPTWGDQQAHELKRIQPAELDEAITKTMEKLGIGEESKKLTVSNSSPGKQEKINASVNEKAKKEILKGMDRLEKLEASKNTSSTFRTSSSKKSSSNKSESKKGEISKNSKESSSSKEEEKQKDDQEDE